MSLNSVGQEFRRSLMRMSLLHNVWGLCLVVWKAGKWSTVGGWNHPTVHSLQYLVAPDAFLLRPAFGLTAKAPTQTQASLWLAGCGPRGSTPRKLDRGCIAFDHLDWKKITFAPVINMPRFKDGDYQPHFLGGRVLNSHSKKHMWNRKYFCCHFGKPPGTSWPALWSFMPQHWQSKQGGAAWGFWRVLLSVLQLIGNILCSALRTNGNLSQVFFVFVFLNHVQTMSWQFRGNGIAMASCCTSCAGNIFLSFNSSFKIFL